MWKSGSKKLSISYSPWTSITSTLVKTPPGTLSGSTETPLMIPIWSSPSMSGKWNSPGASSRSTAMENFRSRLSLP